ncbi:hypothetical protein H4219_003396 [Mycoemilia scoparia]|uniref:Uncharacterized protein n=1 Tax=Mycoemilia scoparia TaxID=417184 RepID=A0A9W7ZUV5_9FUNG|nr:hypothetical protein H4219_003396 [Mycoemilia scoparia]
MAPFSKSINVKGICDNLLLQKTIASRNSTIAASSFVAFCAVLLLSLGNEQFCYASPNPDLGGNKKDSAEGALLGLNLPVNIQLANVDQDHKTTKNKVYHHHKNDHDESDNDEHKHKHAGKHY